LEFIFCGIINNTKVDVTNDQRFNATLVDSNGNGIADRMEWIVPQLSEQEFIIEGIIRITTALHLDENRNFIEDVFPLVSSRDKIYTNPIPINHYIRVSFERELTNANDITIFANGSSFNSAVEVYEVDSDILLASFNNITSDDKYKIFLSTLSGKQDTFDLKVIGDTVEFDYIVDPKIVEHYYVEVTSSETRADNTWANIPGAVINSGNFTVGEQYLLVFTALGRTDNNGDEVSFRVAHGGTVFNESEYRVDPPTSGGTSSWQQYSWFTVWTAANQDITLQFTGDSVCDCVDMEADQITMFAMNLDDDFVEDQDWYYDEDFDDDNLPSPGWTGSNNAQITFTPFTANNDWLVMTSARIVLDNNGDQIETRINHAGSDFDPSVSREGEDDDEDLDIHTIFRVYTLPATSQTFTSESRKDSGADFTFRDYNEIFALNLDRFQNHTSYWNVTEIDPSTTNYDTNVATASLTPENAGPVWAMGQYLARFNAKISL